MKRRDKRRKFAFVVCVIVQYNIQRVVVYIYVSPVLYAYL